MSEHSGARLDELAAAYALGALDPEERTAFEAHVAVSPEAARAVAEFREVAALVSLGGEAQAPDPGLRHRLMERLEHEVVQPFPTSRSSATRGVWWVALAASLIAVLGLAVRVINLSQRVATAEAALARADARLAAREATLNRILEPGVDLYLLTHASDPQPGIQFFWDRNRNVGMLHAFNLTPAPAGRSYQLWLIPENGAPVPSQVFNSEADGHVLVEEIALPTGVFTALAVTEEPTGGSAEPTSTPLLAGNLSL